MTTFVGPFIIENYKIIPYLNYIELHLIKKGIPASHNKTISNVYIMKLLFSIVFYSLAYDNDLAFLFLRFPPPPKKSKSTKKKHYIQKLHTFLKRHKSLKSRQKNKENSKMKNKKEEEKKTSKKDVG